MTRQKKARVKGAGYIYLRNGIYWLEHKINKQRIRKSLGVRHKFDKVMEDGTIVKGAESRAAEILNDAYFARTKTDVILNIAEQRRIINKQQWKLFDVFPYFERRYKRMHKVADSTFLNYIRQWNRFLDWMENNYPEITDPRHVTEQMAEDYWSIINKSASSTANQHLLTLKIVFESLNDQGLLSNPWKNITRLSPDGISKRYLTQEQINHLFGTFAPGEPNDDIDSDYIGGFYAGRNTGQRLEDCALLDWSTIDLNLRQIILKPMKTIRINRVI